MLCLHLLPPSMKIKQIIAVSFLPSRSYCNIMRNFVLHFEKTEATGNCWKGDGVALDTGEKKFQRALYPSPTAQYAVQADAVPFLSGNIATGPHLLLLKDAKEPFEHYLVYCKGTAPVLITTALPADTFIFFFPHGMARKFFVLCQVIMFFSFIVCVVIPFLLWKRAMLILN